MIKNNFKLENHKIISFRINKNNALITITDKNGNTLDWMTSGRLGFKGRQKTSSAAIFTLSLAVAKRLISKKNIIATIKFKGNWVHRHIFLRSLKTVPNLKIYSITEKTPIQHAGCRLPKARRL